MANGKKVLGYALGDTEFYSIDDSDTSVNANGKTYYAVPSEITIKKGTYITYPFPNSNTPSIAEQLQEDFAVDCVGANDAHYFFVGNLSVTSVNYDFQEEEGCGVGEVLKSDCTDIVW
jgi:hypothetical protein